MSTNPAKIRIIGGKWRAKQLPVIEQADLRPTPDRVRETLFNWLHPYLPGAKCLDLFAGTGILGFEALSRGAQSVTFVDRAPKVIEHLQRVVAQLNVGPQAQIVRSELPNAKLMGQYDVVFVDPPYQSELAMPICQWLVDYSYVHAHSVMYLECASGDPHVDCPDQWERLHDKMVGQVRSMVLKRTESCST